MNEKLAFQSRVDIYVDVFKDFSLPLSNLDTKLKFCYVW
jgi:hypothetical protein